MHSLSSEALVRHRVDVDGALRDSAVGSLGVDARDEGIGARGAGDGDEHAERGVVVVVGWGGLGASLDLASRVGGFATDGGSGAGSGRGSRPRRRVAR